MRSFRSLLILCGALTVCSAALPNTASASVDGVAIRLSSGAVTGSQRGLGLARVEAEVTNTGQRAISGVRIGVYYSTIDELPAADADWRIHEFVFEPPLAPGKSTTLRFSDDNAAEYIALDVQRASFGLSLSYNGLPQAAALAERDGTLYIPTRELMDIIGGGISYDSASYMVVLERAGVKLEVKPGLDYALLNGQRSALVHPVLEEDGRSLLPLEDIAPLLGLSFSRNSATHSVELADL